MLGVIFATTLHVSWRTTSVEREREKELQYCGANYYLVLWRRLCHTSKKEIRPAAKCATLHRIFLFFSSPKPTTQASFLWMRQGRPVCPSLCQLLKPALPTARALSARERLWGAKRHKFCSKRLDPCSACTIEQVLRVALTQKSGKLFTQREIKKQGK